MTKPDAVNFPAKWQTNKSFKMADIYHEKQRFQYCAIHAINNMFQDPTACSKKVLDDECYELDSRTWNNPHKSMLKIGNYDVNVIMNFLIKKSYNVIWFDKRRPVSCINVEEVFGFLLNSKSPIKIRGKTIPLKFFKHWYAVRKMPNSLYFNLDSKLEKPVNIGNENKLREFLEKRLSDKETELLLVVEGCKTRGDVVVLDDTSRSTKDSASRTSWHSDSS